MNPHALGVTPHNPHILATGVIAQTVVGKDGLYCTLTVSQARKPYGVRLCRYHGEGRPVELVEAANFAELTSALTRYLNDKLRKVQSWTPQPAADMSPTVNPHAAQSRTRIQPSRQAVTA